MSGAYIGIAIFVLCTFIGFYLKRCVKKDCRYVNEYVEFLDYSLQKISREKIPPEELIKKFSLARQDGWIDKTRLSSESDGKPFSASEYKEIVDFWNNLNSLSFYDLSEKFSAHRENFNVIAGRMNIKGIEADKLYGKMGIIVGLLVLVIML